jgi:hypothetical protein
VPTAALGTIVYGLPLTPAVPAAPALVRVMLATVSLLTRPLTEKSVDGSVSSKTIAVPYVLVLLAAVMVSVLALTVRLPLT